jgi:hypothetical protein
MQRWRHRLEGLEPDNFLAFMTLLGLLRALEISRPAWGARAAWDLGKAPWRPVLSLRVDVSGREVAEAAAEGCRGYAQVCRSVFDVALTQLVAADEQALREFDDQHAGQELNQKQKKERSKIERRAKRDDPKSLLDLARSAEALRQLSSNNDFRARAVSAAWCAEFHSDRGVSVRSTPLKLVAGQMRFVGTALKLAEEADQHDLFDSLFSEWKFMHRGDSFRFAHQEIRQYAYMANDPSKKERRPRQREQSNEAQITGDGVAPSEKGANSLAALAFESLPPVFSDKALTVAGITHGKQRTISWPLIAVVGNNAGATILGTQSMMMSRFNRNTEHCVWMRASIIEPEKDYLNVTPAVLVERIGA